MILLAGVSFESRSDVLECTEIERQRSFSSEVQVWTCMSDVCRMSSKVSGPKFQVESEVQWGWFSQLEVQA